MRIATVAQHDVVLKGSRSYFGFRFRLGYGLLADIYAVCEYSDYAFWILLVSQAKQIQVRLEGHQWRNWVQFQQRDPPIFCHQYREQSLSQVSLSTVS